MTPHRIWHFRRSAYTLAVRRAYTMVELLIVVSIMIMLVAVALPVAKKVMDGGQTREASRQLNAYFAMAKARALKTGRPCGIYFSFPTPPLGLIDLDQPQAPTPFTTPAQFSSYWPVRQATQLQLAETPAPYAGSVTTAVGRVNLSTAISGTRLGTLEVWDRMSPPTVSYSANNADEAVLKSLITNGEQFLVRFGSKGEWYRCLATGGNLNYIGPLWPDSDAQPYGSSSGTQYEVLRAPRPAGNLLTLPTGTCVDMTYSGAGIASRSFLTSSTSINSRITGLTVLMQPNGGVESMYLDTVNQRYIFLGPPVGSLYFLVGKVEKAPVSTANLTTAGPSTYANIDESNLADQNALWVVVSRGTGQVATTENMPLLSASSSLPLYLRAARQAATSGEHMLGR